ncbi:hypothetical protein F2Q68_00038288 [Brassica cretica]|uniref:S-protein homolog n=1 Tax=Brassica cretica TaxID=69181 RepID=A0A8S9MG87_BRACR|nr:hypothetical protein F2Q68_00038288 [Brassica cretica]
MSYHRFGLTMTNNLGGPVFTVHCKSKDNDLGVHMVAAKTDYHFSFQPNIWKTTLFFCSFQWNNQVKQFDIFDAPRDQDDGYKFNWTIKPDGPCKLVMSYHRFGLTMTNNLGGPVFTVHCKSKDNDLGVHMVAAKTDYHFSFQPNIWKTTLFFCSFQWNNQVKQFDIFDAPRDQDDGYKFNWTIKPDGPCKLGEFSESKDGVVSLATFPDIHPDSIEGSFTTEAVVESRDTRDGVQHENEITPKRSGHVICFT